MAINEYRAPIMGAVIAGKALFGAPSDRASGHPRGQGHGGLRARFCTAVLPGGGAAPSSKSKKTIIFGREKMTKSNFTVPVLLLSGVAAIAFSTPAFAQSSNASVPPQGVQASNSGDIVVTATRRAEKLIETPQSISVISSEDLKKLNAVQFVDFANTVPGLQFTTQGAGFTSIKLRGVTTGTDVGPTVGIYVDDVPYGSNTFFGQGGQLTLDPTLFDLDRVEVLRGPQGTLYGASSMGGVLKYVTTAPSLSGFEGIAQAGISSTRFGGISYNGSATVNVPFADKVAVRATGYYSRNGGYVDNIERDENNVDRAATYGGRVDVLLKPSDTFSLRLTGFAQNIRRDGNLYGEFTLAGDPITTPLEQSHPLAEPFRSNFRLVSATANYDFDWATLTAVTAYQVQRASFFSDVSGPYVPLLNSIGVPAAAAATPSSAKTKRFTEEVRLASRSGGRVEWLIGGYYSHEKTIFSQELQAFDANFNVLPVNLLTANIPTTLEEFAAFGNLTYRFSDKFDVTGGLRVAHNNQSFEQFGSGLLTGSRPYTTSSETVTTYLANARYHFSKQVVGYVRFATGYRPGGPNVVVFDPVTGAQLNSPSFASDNLKSYEVGLKAETADRTFSVDASAYYIDWSNIQIVGAVLGLTNLTNAGGAGIKGAELVLTARPDRRTTITGAFAYNDGRLTDADPTLGGRDGERLPNSPHFTATVNADWVLTESNFKPTIGATLRYVSDRTASFDASVSAPQYHLPDYTSVDLRAGATFGRVGAQLFVRNLFDVRGQLSAFTAVAALGAPAQVSILQPRTVGLNLTTRF
jgi:outer membrane receptor protein involved in Fe transport